MHIFTSVTSNYIPKARVLAKSVKQHHEDAKVHLLLSDAHPDWLNVDDEPFDSVINIAELPIASNKGWIFQHSLVELCTAVKGFGFQEIMKRHNPSMIVYLDPDIAVMSGLDKIQQRLQEASILLTPHQTQPEDDLAAIIDNEICSLKHGVYNLGFLGIKNSDEGKRFINWWAKRLEYFCYDDIANGLFTDQRWIDLAPAFFDEVLILRDAVYNVCTWNLTHRTVEGTVPDGLKVNGEKLCFYHFSGFDSGAQKIMLEKYGTQSPVLKDLRDWYIEQCREMGQDVYGKNTCLYNRYNNGEKITQSHRYIYRNRPDLWQEFNDPFNATTSDNYLAWYRRNFGDDDLLPGTDNYEQLLGRYKAVLNDLMAIQSSKSWRALKAIGIAKV